MVSSKARARVGGAIHAYHATFGIRAALLTGACLGLALGPFAANSSRAQSSPYVYVPNQFDNNITAIDTGTNAAVSPTLGTGTYPVTVAVRGDQSLIYATNYMSNTVSVINTGTNAIVATISVGHNPAQIALSPDGTRAYVTNYNGSSISIINTATNTVLTTLTVGSNPYGVTVSPDGTLAYVVQRGLNNVAVINTSTNTVSTTISVGTQPRAIAISPDGTLAYVTNNGTNTISVINTSTNTVVSTITVGTNPLGVTVSPDGSRAYVANDASGTVSIINTVTNTVVATVTVGAHPSGVVFSPDGTQAYVTNSGAGTGNTVSVIDTATNTVSTTVTVGSVPGFAGVCSNGNALLASGGTFTARTSGALSCTVASGVSGPVFTGGTLVIAGTSISSSLPITLQSAGGTIDTAGNNATLSGTISGTGTLTKAGTGTLTLTGNNTYAGVTTISAGTLQIGNGGTSGTLGTGNVTNNATLTFNRSDAVSYAGAISGTGAFQQNGTGTTTLSGNSTYTGTTTVNAGGLAVNGSITLSSLTTVNAGGTLSGTGTVGNTIVAGGSFAPGSGTPGSSMTVTGTLGLNAAATYMVNVNPTASSFATVSGVATLGGATVNASYAVGSYIAKQYTVLVAGSISGAFGALATTSLPVNFTNALSYDATHAYLNLTLNFTAPSTPNYGSGLSGNQIGVGNALINYFNSTGGIPTVYGTLSSSGLNQVSGQPGASTTQSGSVAPGQFVNEIFGNAFGSSGTGGAGAYGYAEADAYSAAPKVSREAKDAYAAVTPRDRRSLVFEGRWGVFASAYGGNNRVSGDATAGTNTTTSRTYGTVVGADYRFTRDTQAGFALGGAGSNFSIDGGYGSGRAEIFNAAVYAKHNFGAAYLVGAATYSWQDTTTDRTLTVSGTDKLRANFKAQAFAARLEGGWRYATPIVGTTPYGALQSTTFFLPSYGETVMSGSNQFALNYTSKRSTTTRTELGARFDKAMVVQDGVLTITNRTAWAHDANLDSSVTATFQSLPSATFTTNGAVPSPNALLASLGAEMAWHNGWSIAALADGEFSRTTRGYTGKGTVRYAW